MGPMWGLIGGIVQDVLGLIVTPTNYPFFGFTLNKVLVGVIPGLVFLVHKKNENKSIKSFLLLLLSLFLVGSLTYLMTLESIVVNQQIVLITNWMKISIAILIILLIGGLIIVVLRSIKIIKSTPISLSYWMLSVILVELIVQLVLTPIWLVTMYQIPVLISFLLRVVKAAVMIPLMILIGYGALVLSDRLMKRRS